MGVSTEPQNCSLLLLKGKGGARPGASGYNQPQFGVRVIRLAVHWHRIVLLLAANTSDHPDIVCMFVTGYPTSSV